MSRALRRLHDDDLDAVRRAACMGQLLPRCGASGGGVDEFQLAIAVAAAMEQQRRRDFLRCLCEEVDEAARRIAGEAD